MFPQSESHYRLALNKCGIKGGFHSLRRFRVTHLRTEGVPDPLVHFWVGHEDETVTDGYTIVKSEIEKRKTWVEKVGLGFTLPTKSLDIQPNL
jgi:integrase